MQEYTITIAEASGAIIEQDEMGAHSPMDALQVYAADRGWKPEKESFDEESGEWWEMRESDGTRIVVEAKMSEPKKINAPRPEDVPQGVVGYVIYGEHKEPGKFTENGEFIPGEKRWVEKQQVYFDTGSRDEQRME